MTAVGMKLRRPADRRQVDNCGVCGRFTGFYPVGFVCDTHCRNCICRRCEKP